MMKTLRFTLALLLICSLLLCCACGTGGDTPGGPSPDAENGYRPVKDVATTWDITQNVDESFDFEQYKAD